MKKKKWKASLLKHRKSGDMFLLVDFNDRMRAVDGVVYTDRKKRHWLVMGFKTLAAAKKFRRGFIKDMAKPEEFYG